MDFTTTVGKTIKTLIWIGISGAIAYLLKFLTDNPDLFNPVTVGIINIVLVAGKNFFDPRIKNV